MQLSEILNDSEQLLSEFHSVSLSDINKVKLMDRMDKKYMFHADLLSEVLSEAQNNYDILEINGKRCAQYETTYFDTPNYEMYTCHHDGKLNRYKVRIRSYIDSDLNFFEIKFKTNTGRTKKSRIQLPSKDYSLNGEVAAMLEKKTAYKASSLIAAIKVKYNRITLISKDLTERITIDTCLSYEHQGEHFSLPELVIAEVKQDKSDNSPFIDIMKAKRIKDESMSKYCLGIVSLIHNVKINNFKPKIRYVNHLLSKTA